MANHMAMDADSVFAQGASATVRRLFGLLDERQKGVVAILPLDGRGLRERYTLAAGLASELRSQEAVGDLLGQKVEAAAKGLLGTALKDAGRQMLDASGVQSEVSDRAALAMRCAETIRHGVDSGALKNPQWGLVAAVLADAGGKLFARAEWTRQAVPMVLEEGRPGGQQDVTGALLGQADTVFALAKEGQTLQMAEAVRPSERVGNLALLQIQKVLGEPSVQIMVGGTEGLGKREALAFVAAQSIERQIPGFELDGIVGKYQLPASVKLSDLKSLYQDAGGLMAEAVAQENWIAWAHKAPMDASAVSTWMPDSVGRLLRGSLSLEKADTFAIVLKDGDTLRSHGAKVGERALAGMLAEQGVDLDRPTAEEIVLSDGFKIAELGGLRNGGKANLSGPVLYQDYKASAIKVSRDTVVIIPHKDLPAGVERPEKGQRVGMVVADGKLQGMTLPKEKGQNVSAGKGR